MIGKNLYGGNSYVLSGIIFFALLLPLHLPLQLMFQISPPTTVVEAGEGGRRTSNCCSEKYTRY